MILLSRIDLVGGAPKSNFPIEISERGDGLKHAAGLVLNGHPRQWINALLDIEGRVLDGKID